jgi:hypothetical protein
LLADSSVTGKQYSQRNFVQKEQIHIIKVKGGACRQNKLILKLIFIKMVEPNSYQLLQPKDALGQKLKTKIEAI